MSITLSQLACAYAQAKAEESRATELRRELAAQIKALTGHTSEGQKAYADGDWKVTIKAPLITSMDWDKWETVKDAIPPEYWPVEMKLSLDMAGVKWIKENDDGLYAILSDCLTVKPGSIQVTVKGA